MSTSARLLRDSCRVLEGISDRLDSAVQDVPRLRKVLETQKVWGLIPLSDLEAARKAREEENSEVVPEIERLTGQIERKLAALRRKKASLETQTQRLSAEVTAAENRSPKRRRRELARSGESPVIPPETEVQRLRFFRQRSSNLAKSKLETELRLGKVPHLPHDE